MKRKSIYGLDGRLIRLFLEVHRTHSVSRAAERLGLTQSTVSHSLERLREALDDPLFVKHGRNIVSTTHADYLVPRMRAALVALEALMEPAEYNPAQDAHPFTIAANPDELHQELLNFSQMLKDQAPGVPLRVLKLGNAKNATDLLESATADFVIAVRRGGYPPDLDHVPLFADRHVTFYDRSKRGPIKTVENFLDARHAALDLGGGQPSLLTEYLNSRSLWREVHVHLSSMQLLGDFVHGTDHVATVPERYGNTVMAGLAKSPVPLDLPEIQYDLIWHRRQTDAKRHIWARTLMLKICEDR